MARSRKGGTTRGTTSARARAPRTPRFSAPSAGSVPF